MILMVTMIPLPKIFLFPLMVEPMNYIMKEKSQLMNKDKAEEHERKVDLLRRLRSNIDKEKLNNFTAFSKFDNEASIAELCGQILEHWDELQTAKSI
ncbi:unnamed protein product [Didymodactylos carnosus]|uniref:Uncharacterized protein n=1 Tax=Didymodactylos carnosus TaxID=1234261 RepID=A0A814QVC2_9BILA|nr:unnamed protein product [Didymodactylos carnosus]CAF3889121.1 unnamed protein product [Didymodactylos carnosus]